MPANAARLSRDVAGATSHRMVRELRDALDGLAQRGPLVLVVEDIHWADEATLDLIEALANRRSHSHLALVATLRSPGPTDASFAAPDMVRRASLYRVARDIKLTRLDFDDVADFLHRYTHGDPPAALTQHLYERSEGNPLFLHATLEHLFERKLVSWDESGWRLDERFESISRRAPPDLLQLIEGDIRDLASGSQKVLEAASLSDGPFTAAVYHVASSLDERAFEAVCETLARQGHFIHRSDVVETPGAGFVQTYTFRHALFQDAAYDRQGMAERAARHAAVAGRLETIFSADLARVASSLARHCIQARLWRKAIHFLSIASRTAMRRFAMREAAGLLEQAAELSRNLSDPERGAVELELLDELSRIYLGAFDKRARATYDRLYPLARELRRVDVEVRAVVGLAYVTSAIDSDRCLELMSQALARSADIVDPEQRERLRCSAHGWRSWILGWSAPDVAGFEAALAKLRAQATPLVLAAGEFDHGLILLPAGRYADSIETVSRGLSTLVDHALEAAADVSFPLWTSRLGIPWALTSLGRFGEAIELSVANCAECEANGHFLRSGTLHLYQAFIYLQMHDDSTALAILDKTARSLESNDLAFPPNEVKVDFVLRGLACLGLGRLESAFEYLWAARAEMEARNTLTSWYWRLVGEWALTDAHLLDGDLDAAAACAEGLLRRARAIEERTWRGLAWEACARVALAQGRASDAGAHLAEAWVDIEGYDCPLVRWRLHAVGALVSESAGERDAARRHVQSSEQELKALAASLPVDHPSRSTLMKARPIMPPRAMTSAKRDPLG
jgi:tetratricopeptide (TPR) repeat protein